jgi:chemotaxis protein MotB
LPNARWALLFPLLLGGCLVRQSTYDAKALEADGYAKSLAGEKKTTATLATDLEKSHQETAAVREERDAARREAEQAKKARDEARHETETALAAAKGAADSAVSAERARLEKAKADELTKAEQEFERARSSLEEQIKKGDVELRQFRDRVAFGVAERVLFQSGSASLGKSGRDTLGKVADTIREMLQKSEAEGRHRLVRVEGHTDDIPIATDRFPSNWDLSSARAATVVRALEAQGVPADKLWVAGFGDHWPVATNGTPDGRARNRRIEVVLVPDSERPAGAKEPAQATAKP